ncbi:DUF4153 domain-containing protein [Pseudoflavitalea sp. X16]|uniref:DUF4153 domain-containing protein n=1 Tax=Paraflavitalea devenefica TaxID=2716334 RepID=UPI001423B048|nr:DUF4153 domain-containing protein [Paraflavitalea devenefica]NII29350.1 DUF4153 domain-containing protein [Paraflavitalea devenefica]
MRDQILSNLDNPAQLERLYREDKSGFKRSFNVLYPELKDSTFASFWNARLNFAKEEISWGTAKDLVFVIITALLAGLIAKLPVILSIDEEFFYMRNAGFIVFPMLSAYFAWKNQLSAGKIVFITGATLVGLLFINFFPDDTGRGDSLILSCIHLPILLWAVLGFAFVGEQRNDVEKRLGYLSYNGDLIVMTTLILIAGGILTGVTIGLFDLIGFKIEKFYFEYVVLVGLPAAPILGTYLIQTNPQLVGKVSPVIARIFSPLVLVMLVIYLIAIIYSGKDPYNDREFLLIFNGLLIGVMAIIFFSVAEASRKGQNLAETWILLLLSVVTIVVNGIALSAILFRISAWGFTPNRAAVLGSNALILINLLLVTVQLFRVVSKKTDITGVGKVISWFLPVYCVWAIIVTFLFPFLFEFK